MKTHLVWFRNDLRVTDNPALYQACANTDANVIALYIATPEQWVEHNLSPRQADFIHKNLLALQTSLANQGISLLYRQVGHFHDAVGVVVDICRQYKVDELFYNYQYPYNETHRDRLVELNVGESVKCAGYHDSLLFTPLSILNHSGQMYKVFTPFRQACIKQLRQTDVVIWSKPAKRGAVAPMSTLPAFDYPKQPCSSEYQAGESAALLRLKIFCLNDVADYLRDRDTPALDKTSRLSAYLAIGVISVRQCFHELYLAHPLFLQQPESGAFGWFNELIWREFYQHLLVAYPKLSMGSAFISWTEAIKWDNDPVNYERWQQGKTGYPIVDAAMRQLNQTGWMHNRLRMISAGFLVKDLLIDWRWGERYFMSQLIDGDLAANNGGWQWSASTGTDSAPYFRIFNPITQGLRFDSSGQFIRQWIPELAMVPDEMIHTPHLWAEGQNVSLNYPLPIVMHKQARAQTLSAYTAAKNHSGG